MGKLRDMFKVTDMTVGSPWQKILIFSLPLVVGNIAQQLYSTVDSIIVGHYVGDNALAAVGSATPLFNLILVLFMGISTGTSIMVSQYVGAKSREDLGYTVGNSIVLSMIASIFLMIVGPLFVRPLLGLLNTPASIFEWCVSYLNYMLYGIIGMVYYNVLGGILRGLGDSFSSLIYLLVATVINIVLDIIFVGPLGMGVAGAALATVIAQGISAILCLRKLLRMQQYFELKLLHLKLQKKHVGLIVKLGIPSGVTQAIFSVANIIVQSLTNQFGEMFIAANVIVMRVDGFAVMPAFSFSTAMTTFAGQNVGAGKTDRLNKGAFQGTFIAMLTSAILTALILIFGRFLMGIFTTTEDLVNLSRSMMNIIAPGYVLMALIQALSGVMRGAGDTLTPMWISIVSTVAIRVPTAYVLAYITRSAEYPIGRQESIFVSLLISWIVGAIISILCYRFGKWKRKGIQHRTQEV